MTFGFVKCFQWHFLVLEIVRQKLNRALEVASKAWQRRPVSAPSSPSWAGLSNHKQRLRGAERCFDRQGLSFDLLCRRAPIIEVVSLSVMFV
jgi:hypothetical protein